MIRLGILQRAVLLRIGGIKGSGTSRTAFVPILTQRNPKTKDIQEAVTKTLERLIDGGYLTGYGVRTPKKWYIREVRLTALGRKAIKQLRGKQLVLPLKK